MHLAAPGSSRGYACLRVALPSIGKHSRFSAAGVSQAVSAAFVPLSADVSGCPVRLRGPLVLPPLRWRKLPFSSSHIRVFGSGRGSPRRARLCACAAAGRLSVSALPAFRLACHARVSFGERGGASGGWAGSGDSPLTPQRSTRLRGSSEPLCVTPRCAQESHVVSSSGAAPHSTTTSDQTRQPAEFKHITKRRKRN
ncbi:hypothetical protein NQZ68_000645 [Dissostichus eleginoides]|nr:hypothetical protein NQZ68_000645 [Dissostichus eleginoides]